MASTSIENEFTRALGLASDPENTFLELGRALVVLLVSDPASFNELLGTAGLPVRKAYFLVNISRAFDPLAIPRERLHALGWVKLQMLAGHIDADNAEALLQMAEANTAADLGRLLNSADITLKTEKQK
jgi:hypothetical protein